MIAEVLRPAILSLSMLCFLFSGCARVNIPDKSKAEFVDIFEGQHISDYKLLDNHTTNFEFLLKPAKKDSILRRKTEELFIDLRLIDERKIRISLANQYGDTLIREYKGRFEENTFRLRKKWFLVGNPLVWVLGTHDNVFARNNLGELLLYHTRGGMGFVALIPIMGTSNGVDIHRFEKIK